MKRKVLLILAGVTVLLLLYLLFWPVPIDAAAWTPPDLPSLTGVYAQNNQLEAVEQLGEGVGIGPEGIAIDSEGRNYAGMEDGRIIRFAQDGSSPQQFVDTGGRPLGMDFDATGALIVADAFKGLLSIEPGGVITILADEINGQPIRFANDLDIAADGTIYFSNASTKFSIDEVLLDIMEHRPNGQLLAYDPSTGATSIVLDDLYFANGIAISPDQSYLLFAETIKYRVIRYWLDGPNQGQTEVFIENLPGFPDNITFNGDNTYWLALNQGPPSRAILDPLLPLPFLREVFQRLPDSLSPQPSLYGYVLGLDLNGEVIYNLQDPTGETYADISSVIEHDGMLYIGSTSEDSIGRVQVP